MEKSNIISNYFITDYKALLRTTEQLFKDKQIQSYLTSEQNVILYELLKIENYDVKLKHWTDLLDGKLKLQSSLIENDHSVDENNKDEVIDEFLKMDLQNLQERLSSDGFLSALSLKIRYCLWEQPLRIWLQDDLKDYKLLRIYNEYKTSTLEANDDDNDDMLDDIKYVIMDPSESQDTSTNQDNQNKDITVNPVTNNDDDDYDMDDEEEEAQQSAPKESSESG
ncbi:unnamed protein product [Hanseniaspora opuntiae]